MKKLFFLTVIALGVLNQSACIDDDGASAPEFPPIDRGNIEANRVIISFSPMGDTSTVLAYEYYDADGFNTGNAPTVNQQVGLKFSSSGGIRTYDAKVQFFIDSREVTSDIENLDTKYIVCYLDMNSNNLRLHNRNFDSNNKFLGTETTWQVLDDRGGSGSANGSGKLRITLNYLPTAKEETCNQGIRIFEGILNYQHN